MIRSLRAALLALCALAGSAQAATTTYFHNDLAGSPIAATNENGQVIWRESYRPYGERLTQSAAASGNKIWFTSRRQDAETGLVYMGARYYDPVVGRFMSTDPVQFMEPNPHSFNRYAYANNNPYKYVDPDGKSAALAFCAGGPLGCAIGVGLTAITAYYAVEGVKGTARALSIYNEVAKSDDAKTSEGDGGKNKFPDRKLPRDENGNPKADPEAEGAHTQLGQRQGQRGKYDQAREFDASGKPVRDVDFTDQGRPGSHPNPHEHRYLPNATGGTPQRGPTEPLK